MSLGKTVVHFFFKNMFRLGMVAHVYNPSTLGGHSKRITLAKEFESIIGNVARPHLYKKNYF